MNFFRVRAVMRKIALMSLLLALCSCYQMHSGDDLRGVPVTNNPTVVPNTGSAMGRFTAMNP